MQFGVRSRSGEAVASGLGSFIFPVPDADFDQFPIGDLRSDRAANDPGDLDAAPQERGTWRGFWRRRDREYFWRSNHQCPGQIHRLAGWNFLCPDFRIVGFVFAQDQPRYGIAARAPQAANDHATVGFSSAGKSKRAVRSSSGRARGTGGKRGTECFGDSNCANCAFRLAET
jgi:hypothetical protein